MYDIFFVSRYEIDDDQWNIFKNRFPRSQKIENVKNINDIKSKSLTRFFWIVWDDLIVDLNFNFDYRVSEWDDSYIHVFRNGHHYDGILLVSKDHNISDREFNFRFFSNKKEIDILASIPKSYDKFFIDTYDEYLHCLETIRTDMFWVIWNDIDLLEDFNFDYQVSPYEKTITHVFLNGEHKDGLCLFSRFNKVSKKEFDHRFFIDKKEVDIVASTPRQYDKFIIDTYEDYLNAAETSKTELFWFIPKEVELLDFDFDLYFSHHNSYDRNMNHLFQHIFRNEKTYNGIGLFTKNKLISKKEVDFRFPIDKKQYEKIASRLRPYDIIFISYNESNAEANWQKLKNRFPRAQRVHGVKGIHNAHKKAAELSTTDMFYVVDGDAEIVDDFYFNYEVSRHERDIVFVWQSQNPINELVYGYGGVKLLPRNLVLDMDMNSVDMTLSISDRFKSLDQISNLTRFDTDEFSTWKSAFRECVKLASRPVTEDYDEQTDIRLQKWCSLGISKPYGKFCIDGAIAGREYGYDNMGDFDALRKINDFEWLKAIYEQRRQNIHT
jgi:hypothetical protein